ncbi:MAG: beta-galactosidase [Treponema sp.]|nr:beta-galactosidase [Treponema sp.]
MDSGIVSYDKHGFIINGKREFLIGGEFHYFRVPSALWEDRLQKMKACGANLISVYIAWNLHEPEEGSQRWSGDYDLDRFLTLCKKYGFFVLIKPGPYICAELDFGGHPDWLIGKIARGEFRLRTLDKKYLELCRYWYKSCCARFVKHLITNGGCIIAAQIENEYDHLIEYGEETITTQDAIDYFMFLKNAMEEFGVNVPKFANEAEFLRGRGIIDTRTYYPNIPGLWMWEFERFEEKLLSSKKSQSDSPIMILELQAGWFSQIGSPTYSPGLEVVEGVSKSVFITGASIINYYMMVGGTTFPFIGARGDTVLGGHGNITSYDFGGAPIGETGELHKSKFYWLRGFIRFAKEYSNLITQSDGKRYAQIVSGGGNIAVLGENAALDLSLDRSFENFTTYEEGNENGRFFFVRNAEDEAKELTVNIPETLTGAEYKFCVSIAPKETRLFPLVFKAPSPNGGSDLRIGYSTSEVLLSKTYKKSAALVLCGKTGTNGEMALNAPPAEISALEGDVNVYGAGAGSVLCYKHSGINIVKARDVYFFIIEDSFNGRIEELSGGLLFHNCYYLQTFKETENSLSMTFQIREYTDNIVQFFPVEVNSSYKKALLNGRGAIFHTDRSGMQTAFFPASTFLDRPQVQWTSAWKYTADSDEVRPEYDHFAWRKLEKPVSLEEAGLYEHGYFWYRTNFDLRSQPQRICLDFNHNETDRYLLYLNGELIFRTRNKSIVQKDITGFVKTGNNTLVMLYANEFHNKSHPHEGAIVKFSGIRKPITLSGAYNDGKALNISLETFYVKQGLQGLTEGFTKTGFDDSSWHTAPDAEKFVVGREMGHIIWFRRHFRYSAAEQFSAPLKFAPHRADERLTVYCNGRPIARYDILGPQEEFYIPDSYIDPQGDNVLAVILECPGFYEEIMSGYRRGYMYNPALKPDYISEKVKLEFI